MSLVNIVWNDEGCLYYVPVEVQRETIISLGKSRFME